MASAIESNGRAVAALNDAASALETAIWRMAEEVSDAADASQHDFVQLVAEDIAEVSRVAVVVLDQRKRAERRGEHGS